MTIANIDWIIIALYFVVSITIGIIMARKAGRSTGDFFLSGRELPWYIAGTSMVATTFAADTPLAVTELVSQNGIAGNWLWWNLLLGGMLTVFFYARLWRRAGILTDCEFVNIRYSGKAARFLRGFRAVYIGIFMNVIVIAWVNLAMLKILQVMFPDFTINGQSSFMLLGNEMPMQMMLVAGLLAFVSLYSALSGLWGVSLTDTFQFVVAMGGTIALAVVALNAPGVGGIEGLQEKLPEWVFEFTPKVGGEPQTSSVGGVLQMSIVAFVAYLGVQWWASWYPGSEPGGGGYIAQRMMSAKNEKHSLLATLWYQVAHFALRPWPWIIVALVALVLYPDADDKGATFIMVMRDFLPAGLLGLLMAAFLAAFMSTISSQTVWGTSYIVNDLFRPFVKPGASEKYYVKISRLTTVLLMLLSFLVTGFFDQISDAWKFILACSGGIGLVLLLRWFWWRINAWSEISAMIAPYFVLPVLIYGFNMDVYQADFGWTLIIIVAFSSLVWITVTLLTKPTDHKTLKSFYKKVHPGGAGWKRIAGEMPEVTADTGYIYLFSSWIFGCIMILSFLFAIGDLIFGNYIKALIETVICISAVFAILYSMRAYGWKNIIR
ncbi:MAG: sodium:solute symporter family protein [Bacteroidota bacterium]